MRDYIRKHNIVIFFVTAFALSWALWLMSGLFNSKVLKIMGTFGPALSALMVTCAADGLQGLRKLFHKFTIWKVNAGWYLFSFFSTAAVASAAIWIYGKTGGGGLEFNDPSQWYMVVPVFLYVLFLSVLGEETGWRGFAQERLQRRFGALPSSLLVGLLWGLWHFPLFHMNGDFHTMIPFGLFMIQAIALSVVTAWIYNKTKGSLIPVHLFHAASNVTLGILPVLPSDTSGNMAPLYLTVGILVIISVLIAVYEWEQKAGIKSFPAKSGQLLEEKQF